MLIGYARVSTADQILDLQLDALKKLGCEKIFEDIASGGQSQRKGLEAALDYVRKGDSLVVWRLDRLGRSLSQLITLLNDLSLREVGFQSVVEAIDTTTPAGKFFFQVTGAFAELERNLIRERTRAGLNAARARGRNGGRPKALEADQAKMALQLYKSQQIPVGKICDQFKVSPRTLYRYLKGSNFS